MLTPARSLVRSIASAPELPRVRVLKDLYSEFDLKVRHGEMIMIVGRSGSGKSTFGEYLVAEWNLPTLYFSSDMNAYQASVKLAESRLCASEDKIRSMLEGSEADRRRVLESIEALDITFSFGKISWQSVDAEIEAYVELNNRYPSIMVFDNLMDIEGCDSGYAEQQEAMEILHDMSRAMECTVIVMHHATDKTQGVEPNAGRVPARKEIKNGLSEKPELILGVALNPHRQEFNIGVLKQRMGKSDESGFRFATIEAIPAESRYELRQAPALPHLTVIGGAHG